MSDRKAPADTEIIFSDKFWCNRKGEAICIEIKQFNGEAYVIDVRKWFTNREGKLRPTGNGVCISVRKLAELKDGICKVHDKASELGLIKSDGKP